MLKTIKSIIKFPPWSINYHRIECLIKFQVHFNYTEALFFSLKINKYGVYAAKKRHVRKGFQTYKKRRCTTIISHINNNKSNNLNTSNSDNAIVMSTFPHSNVNICSSLNIIISLQKLIDTESLKPTLLIWFTSEH